MFSYSQLIQISPIHHLGYLNQHFGYTDRDDEPLDSLITQYDKYLHYYVAFDNKVVRYIVHHEYNSVLIYN